MGLSGYESGERVGTKNVPGGSDVRLASDKAWDPHGGLHTSFKKSFRIEKIDPKAFLIQFWSRCPRISEVTIGS